MSGGVAVVIPAYDEAASVASVVAAARRHGLPVVVDDGSRDATSSVAEGAGATVLRHEANRGYDEALRTGFEWAVDHGCDVVVTIDADAQHDPDRIAGFVAPIREGRAGAVLGTRPGFARTSERLFCAYARRRYGIPDVLCGMKAFSSEAVCRHRSALSGPSIGTGLALACLRAGEVVEVVPVAVRPREGVSRFGDDLSAELRVLRALVGAVVEDTRAARRPPAGRRAPSIKR